MRPYLILLNLISSTILFAQVKKISPDPFLNAGKKTEITGHIKNYIPGNSNRFIRFRTYDISGRSKDTTFFIDKTGHFIATFPQQFESDIAMMYDEDYITLYSSPGEKIAMQIDPANLSSRDKNKAVYITGKSAAVSKLIMQFKLNWDEFLSSPEESWSDDSTLSDKTIAEARVKRMNKALDSLQRWITKNAVTNKTFANWEKHTIMYEAGSEITHFLYAGERRKLNDEQLIELLKDIPIDNPRALNSSAYYSFLGNLAFDMQIIVNVNPMYDSVRRRMGKNSMPIYLDKIDKYSKGFAKQIMYYHTLTGSSVEKAAPYSERFDSVIKKTYLRDLISAKKNSTPFKPYSIIQRLKDYKVDDSLKARLITIFETNKRNLFLDFWGSWCAPCMREMPLYPKLMDELKDSSFSFLFLAVETSEEKALEIKNKYGIDAPFIVLTDNETRILNHVLEFSSYPSHYIISPDGFVKKRLSTGLVSGSELSKVALTEIKSYSGLWY
jgi:thiol-disulfide isomerase/thioredoxin